MSDDLPDDVDPELWFWSEQCGGRDYLVDGHWLTHPGRMAVFCPHDTDHPAYRISKSELPADLPDATRWFVKGFLAGNLPDPPDDEDDSSPTMQAWSRAAQRFADEGSWRIDVDAEGTGGP
jgi:hypothetical protein